MHDCWKFCASRMLQALCLVMLERRLKMRVSPIILSALTEAVHCFIIPLQL